MPTKTDRSGRTALSRARTEVTTLREQLKQVEQANDLLIAQAAKMDQREKLLEQRIAEWEKRHASEVEEHNRTRGLLMSSELAYAKLRGYVEGMADGKPPELVPEQRESALARMPDGSQGSGASPGYYGDAAVYSGYGSSRERSKPWYAR